MKPAKYMVQSMGLYGLNIVYGDNLKKTLKKARVSPDARLDEFGIFTVRNGGIVRVARNGRAR